VKGGDKVDAKGCALEPEAVELYKCDALECVTALLGNPAFKDVSKYASETTFLPDDEGGEKRVFSKMWTGDWWKKIEVCIRSICTCPESS
jgi:hypothetical protein